MNPIIELREWAYIKYVLGLRTIAFKMRKSTVLSFIVTLALVYVFGPKIGLCTSQSSAVDDQSDNEDSGLHIVEYDKESHLGRFFLHIGYVH